VLGIWRLGSYFRHCCSSYDEGYRFLLSPPQEYLHSFGPNLSVSTEYVPLYLGIDPSLNLKPQPTIIAQLFLPVDLFPHGYSSTHDLIAEVKGARDYSSAASLVGG
jgi:hypothetical protein